MELTYSYINPGPHLLSSLPSAEWMKSFSAAFVSEAASDSRAFFPTPGPFFVSFLEKEKETAVFPSVAILKLTFRGESAGQTHRGSMKASEVHFGKLTDSDVVIITVVMWLHFFIQNKKNIRTRPSMEISTKHLLELSSFG